MKLVIDNGSYSIKIGTEDDEEPQIVSNAVVRTKDKRVLIGKLIDQNQNISGCYFKRPFERNQLCSWEYEKLIWDYCLNSNDLDIRLSDPSDTDLVVTEPFFTLPKVSKNMDQILFEEYGFNSFYKAPAASFVPLNWTDNEALYALQQSSQPSETYQDFQLVIDSGFDSTYVVPMIYGVVYWDGIRRLDIGGRFLTGFLRELISFRHYDVTDETILVNNIKESTCFVPYNYSESLEKLKKERGYSKNVVNDDSMTVEYVLPDFKHSAKGFLLTDKLRRENGETLQELQTMKLYDERFSVPETLFDPEIANIKHRNGLIACISDAVYACPELVRPLLVSNITCVGGNFNIPGFQKRLESELERVLPVEWDIRVGVAADPSTYAWKCARKLALNEDLYQKLCVTREEYMEKGWGYLREKFECKLTGWNK